VLTNLLSNAIRFTEAGGRVTVACGRADRAPTEAALAGPGPWAVVRVEDTGVGIPPDQLEQIWQAFVQVDASRTRKFGGSGLGLTISRHLARLMGGDITVRSQPGLGSSVALWLPAADPAEVRASRAPAGAAPAGAESPERAMLNIGGAERTALRTISQGLLSSVELIVSAYVERLRTDEGTPSARGLGEAQLEDHGVTFLADIAQCLALVGDDGPEALTMLRDGSAIQRLVANRHGMQRARLRWSEGEVRRELEILREELHAAVHRLAGPGVAGDSHALSVIDHFLAQAQEETLAAFRRERG
jgi:hypothetical protein